LFVPAELEQARNAPLYSIRIWPRERTRSPYKSSKCATRPLCVCVSITLPAVSASHAELYLTSFRGISRTKSPFAQPN